MMLPARMVYVALVLAVVSISDIIRVSAWGDVQDDKSREVLNSWIASAVETMSIKIEPKILPMDDKVLQDALPNYHFYGVYFPTWPRAVMPPKKPPYELSDSNVVGVRNEESVEPIGSEASLRGFLERLLADVKDEERARAAVLASLRLAAAVAKHGPYQLEKPNVSVVRKEENIVASAMAAAQEPARGEVTIQMKFSADGAIMPDSIKIDNRLRPGPPS